MATALVALATIGGSPIKVSAPKEKNVPPPATAFSVPERRPAAARIRISLRDMARRGGQHLAAFGRERQETARISGHFAAPAIDKADIAVYMPGNFRDDFGTRRTWPSRADADVARTRQ